VPAIPSCIQEPLWDQFTALLPTRHDSHPLGCHRRRIPDRIIFDKLIQILVFGCGYRRIADRTCSATTLRRRRDEWIALGVADQLHRLALAAYDRMHGLELEHLAVDGCITKAPCGGQVAGPSPVDRRKQGLKRSVATEAHGVPLTALPAPANRRDDGLLAATLEAAAMITAAALGPLPATPTVHLDAGYDYQSCREVLARAGHGRSDRHPWAASTDPGWPPVGDRAHPCLGQPVRQAAMVHRTPPSRGRVLVAAGLGAHHRGSAHPPRLDLLPMGRPPPPPPMTTYWRRP
jgi:transposase